MSKRAEASAKEIYKDGIQLVGRRDRNNNIVIHPETMVGVLRNAAKKGYEQAEKDLALTKDDVKSLIEIWMNLPDFPQRPLLQIAEETLNIFNEIRKK